MKLVPLSLALAFLCAASARADLLTQWTFNSPDYDFDPRTGTLVPAVGSGTAAGVGTVAPSFGSLSASSSDPDNADNTKWRFAPFPTQGSENKTSGAEFRVSTVGFENITISWDHYNSATGSKYWRVQYSTNGVDFIDHEVRANPLEVIFHPFNVSFAAFPGVNNNPNFAFRLVSEFASTATGAGPDAYVATRAGSGYGTGGTLWLDMVTVNGTPLDPSNTHPTIQPLADRTNRINQVVGPIALTVGDAETPAAALTLSAQSSNPALIQNFAFGGSGANRTVTLTPEADQMGVATITVLVTDAGGKSTATTFELTVLPANTPPLLSSFSNQVTVVNTPTNIAFTLSDLETPADDLVITFESSNPTLLPPGSFIVTGNGNNRSLQLAPAANQVGAALVKVTVSDGALSAQSSFVLKVGRPHLLALWDFNSPTADANALTGSALPALGAGTFATVGTVTNSFGSLGSPNTDPETSDDSSMRFGQFPAQSTANKTSGAEFRIDTTGYGKISLTWDHYNSASGSKYWRVQYSLDGVNFTDHLVHTNPVEVTTLPAGADFSTIPGANNNPHFAIRLVSEFESTATGAGGDSYVATKADSNYSTAGTLWIDMITVTAEPLGSGPAPTLHIARTEPHLRISWDATATGFILQGTANLNADTWTNIDATPSVEANENVVLQEPATCTRFYRLVKP